MTLLPVFWHGFPAFSPWYYVVNMQWRILVGCTTKTAPTFCLLQHPKPQVVVITLVIDEAVIPDADSVTNDIVLQFLVADFPKLGFLLKVQARHCERNQGTRILVMKKGTRLDEIVRAVQVLGLSRNRVLEGDKIGGAYAFECYGAKAAR